MSKVILENGVPFVAASKVSVFGTTGNDIVKVLDFAGTEVTSDASIERVEFARPSTGYTYKATSTGVQVLLNGTVVTNLVNGQKLAFTDGSATVTTEFNPATASVVVKLGGVVVPTTAGAVAFTPDNTAGEASTITTGSGGTGSTTGQAFSLTATAEVKTLGTGNDTVNGTLVDSLSGDTIVDASTTDSDTLNAVVNLSGAITKPTISNVETINLDNNFGSVTNTLDVSGISGGTLNLTSSFGNAVKIGGGGGGAGAVLSGSQNLAVKTGSGITTLTVEDITANPTIELGAAVTSLTLKGAGAGSQNSDADAVTVKLNGNTLATFTNTDNATTDIDVLNLVSQTAANTVTLTASTNGSYLSANSEKIAVTGDKALTIKGVADGTTAANNALAGAQITNGLTGGATLSVELTGALVAATGARADLSKIAATTIQIGKDATAAADLFLEVANNASIDWAGTLGRGVTIDGKTGTTNTLNLTATNETLDAADVLTLTDITTVNYTAAKDQTFDSAVFGAGATVNVSGAKNLSLTTAVTAADINATNLTGNLTTILSANSKKVTAGSGNDTVTLYAGDFTVVGGNGTDKLLVAADTDLKAASVSFTGFEAIDLNGKGTSALTVNNAQITGKTLALAGSANDELIVTMNSLVGTTADLSGVTGAAGVVVTVTGTNAADTIKGSALADTITAGQENDNIDLSAGGSDTVIFNAVATNGKDTITGFKGGATASGGDVLTVEALGAGNIASESAITVAAAQGAFVDANAYVISTDGTAGNLTTSGTKVVTDWTDLAQVAAYMAERFTLAGGDDDGVLVVNTAVTGATQAYVYNFVDAGVANTWEAGDLVLVGVISTAGNLTTDNTAFTA